MEIFISALVVVGVSIITVFFIDGFVHRYYKKKFDSEIEKSLEKARKENIAMTNELNKHFEEKKRKYYD